MTLAVFGLLALYCFTRLEITNSITHFIPKQNEAELVDLSLKLVESPLAQRMLISVSGGSNSEQVADELREVIKLHPEVDWVEAEFDPAAMRKLYDVYFDRRMYMLSSEPRVEIPMLLQPESLAERADLLKRRLSQPGSMLLARGAPADPLGIFEMNLDRILAVRPQVPRNSEGTEADSHSVFVLGLSSTPFDSERQTQLLDHIEEEFARLSQTYGGNLVLEQSGVNRFAVATERSVRRDGNLVSVAVICAVSGLFLIVFRSMGQLLIALFTPMAGFVAAMAVAVSDSAPVHGITLAFGFVLIGVAIDYAIHLMSHHALAPSGVSAQSVARRIGPSLVLSASTTTVAFLALAVSDFPGLAEMGRFAAIGIPIALGVTLISIPTFLSNDTPPTAALLGLSQRFDQLVDWLEGRRWIALAGCAVGVCVIAAGLPQIRWEDDPSSLMTLDPELIAESERVRERISDFDGGRFIVALAGSPEEVLVLNDRVARRLDRAVEAGELAGVGSLHAFLWSEALQRENLETLQAVTGLGNRIDSVYTASGFRPGSFDAFYSAVANPPTGPLRPSDLEGSALERFTDSLVDLDGRWAVVTYLRGVQSSLALRGALKGLKGVHYIDQREIMAGVYGAYRRSTLQAITIGSVLVLLILLVRYRNIRRAILAFLPPGIAALATLGLFGLIGTPVSIVSAISLIVVLGMGVDYGIFAVDTAAHHDRAGITMAGLMISCLTSLFVFGLLSFASQPVLRSIGLTTGIGVLLAFIFSPVALVLSSRVGESHRRPL
jgi:predicted exporter